MKYGVFKYGAAKYGSGVPVTPTGDVQWIFLVDWDGNGSYSYNESAYLVNVETMRGARYFVRTDGSGFEDFSTGEGYATLTNHDGRFDPDNTSGPLYGKILPGRKFLLRVKIISSGVVYPVMAGIIYDIPPVTEDDRVQLNLRESTATLTRNITLPVLYRRRISEGIKSIVDAAAWDWPTQIWLESQQITAITVDNVDAWQTIQEMAAASLGQVFAAADGTLKYYPRHYSDMQTVTVDQADVAKTIRRSQPWENVRNIVQITANKKSKQPEAPIWEGELELKASGTTTATVEFDAAIDVRTYRMTFNTGANKSGSPASGSVTYTETFYPRSVQYAFTNTFAGKVYAAVVITGRKIVDQPVRLSVQDASSVAAYGERVFNLDSQWLQDQSHAQAFTAIVLDKLKTPQRSIEVTFDQQPTLQYSFDLLDKVTFTSAKLGINAAYHVGRIEHRWQSDTGQAVQTVLVMVPRITNTDVIYNDAEEPNVNYVPGVMLEEYQPPDDDILPGLPTDFTLPEIPDIDFPGIPPTTPPQTIPAPGGTCLTDPAAAGNGPYSIGGFSTELSSNSDYRQQISIPGGAYLRQGNAANPSYVTILGDWQRWDAASSSWVGDTSTTNWRVLANGNIDGEKQPYTDQGSGARTLIFHPGGPIELQGIIVEIDPSAAAVYNVSTVVASGAITTEAGTQDELGQPVSLIPGETYCVEWYDNEYWNYGGGPASGVRVHAAGEDSYTQLATDPSPLPSLGGGRIYFSPTNALSYVRVADGQFGDNNIWSAAVNWKIYRATVTELRRWVIKNISFGNVCSK